MKKILAGFILSICLIVPCLFSLTACSKKTSPDAPATIYTVSESEWETNFNITKVQGQSQSMSCVLLKNDKAKEVADTSSRSLDEITSYTLSAIGTDYQGSKLLNGSGVLKVAQNGLNMEFYLDGELQEEQTKTISSSDSQYIGLKMMLTSYFAFSGKYNNFRYNEAKKAYVAENLVVSVVDENNTSDTYDLFNKKVEVTFINGYLNTIAIELCDDDSYAAVMQTFMFTFSDINNTMVVLS